MLVGILCISMFGGEADGEVRRFFNWWFASSIIVVFMSSIIALPGVVRFTHALFDQLTGTINSFLPSMGWGVLISIHFAYPFRFFVRVFIARENGGRDRTRP